MNFNGISRILVLVGIIGLIAVVMPLVTPAPKVEPPALETWGRPVPYVVKVGETTYRQIAERAIQAKVMRPTGLPEAAAAISQYRQNLPEDELHPGAVVQLPLTSYYWVDRMRDHTISYGIISAQLGNPGAVIGHTKPHHSPAATLGGR